MRILHTSDWHLGRQFHGVQLLDAQVAVLDSLVEVTRDAAIDVVVLAGDIYDRAVPSADAVGALDHLLAELHGAGVAVVGISGNHDSAVRVGFAERVLSAAGVTIRGDIALAGEAVVIPSRDGESAARFYPIPYLEPEVARHALGVPEARSHERLLKHALDRARHDASKDRLPTVAIAHAFVTGGQGSDSELALAVGGSAEVPLRHFQGFDYAALGHLHGRQTFSDGIARYSGSPLPYSFSERNHTKGAWIVDVRFGHPTTVEAYDFPVHRPLAQIRGTMETLLNDSGLKVHEQSFVHAIVHDTVLPLDAMGKLRSRFIHAVQLSHEPPEKLSVVGGYAERVRGRTDLELALDFFEHVAGRSADHDERHEFASAINANSGTSPREHAA